MTLDRIRVVLGVDASGAVSRAGQFVDLGPDTSIDTGEGETRTLKQIVDAYAAAEQFSDLEQQLPVDAQQAIGETLYRALGGDAFVGEMCRWLEIAIEDCGHPERTRFLQRLPWPFLAQPDSESLSFLVQDEDAPWVVTLDGAPRATKEDVLFPPEPHILLVITQSDPDNQGAEHEAEIREALRPWYTAQNFENNVRTARTWPEVSDLIRQRFDADVMYFYGHGLGGREGALLFDPELGQTPTVTARQIGQVIGAMNPEFRPIVFIGNCCHGTSAARTGLGQELSDKIHCLIANRTVVDVPMARAFGTYILRRLALEGASPAQFLGEVNQHLVETVSGTDIGGRWACPVVFTNFSRWRSLLPERSRALLKRETAGDVTERIDRKKPLNLALEALGPLLGSKGIGLGAFAWQGEKVQGIDAFGRRLRDAIFECFSNMSVGDFVVDLLSDTMAAGSENHIGHILAAIFAALAPPRDPRRRPDYQPTKEDVLKLLTKQLSGTGVVLLIRAGSISIGSRRSQSLIQAYWRVWIDLRKELEKLPQQNPVLRIVLTVALELPAASRIQVAALLQAPADDPSSRATDVGILTSVEAADITEHLKDFLKFYDSVSGDTCEQKAHEIYSATAGVFEPTQLVLRREGKLA
jgi:hypothetical protein